MWRTVASSADVKSALKEGARNRATASTALNAASSRSHALVSVKVGSTINGKTTCSLMHLVDLAGEVKTCTECFVFSTFNIFLSVFATSSTTCCFGGEVLFDCFPVNLIMS